jgi:hypothetical protein
MNEVDGIRRGRRVGRERERGKYGEEKTEIHDGRTYS